MRIFLVSGLLLGAMGLLAWRSLELQVLRAGQLMQRAERQYYQKVTLPAKRGAMYDRFGRELAVSLKVPSIYALPPKVVDKREAARRIAKCLGMDPRKLEGRLRSRRSFVWIKRHATPKEAQAVKGLGIEGIEALPETRRFYPCSELAAPLLGFVGVDAQGLEGLERAYDRWLKAPSVVMILERDALGRWIYLPSGEPITEGPWDLYLSLDLKVQHILEKELKAGIMETGAKGAAGVILDPYSGEVLAMASLPSFNPNLFQKYPPERWRNKVVVESYEPGSLMKVFLVAAALEERLVKPTDLFFCEGGKLRVGPGVIHDVKPHRWLTVEGIVQHSSNIGATKMAFVLGPYRYYKYLRAFGFGSETGIGLPGEEKGVMRSPRQWSRIDLATLAFGQGMAATPLQLAVAFSAIANGGVLVRPYVVKGAVKGGQRRTFGTELRRRVISSRTSRLLLSMMKRVVSDGTGVRAAVEGYSIAGKTGTSQKFDPSTGTYSRRRFVASFVGFLPADTPKAVILVMLDEPTTAVHGGTAAAPIFKRVAEELAKYWGLPPRQRLALSSGGT